MQIEFDDDAAIHAPTDAIDWRESYYVNFFDHDSDLHGLAWQGVRPNEGLGEAVFLLFDGDKPLVHSIDLAVPVAQDIGQERLALRRQSFECITPWRHWAVRYRDGDAEVDVDWHQSTAVCAWHYDVPAERYEVSGRVSVEATVGGRRIAFEGYGTRDRAWGVRNYGPMPHAWWAVAQFPDGMVVHVNAAKRDEGYGLYGFLHQDGASRELVSFEADGVAYSGDSGPPEAARQRFVDDAGRELVIAGLDRMHYVPFRTEPGGSQLQNEEPGDQETGRFFFSFQRFQRSDGVVGRGMIDLVLWRGNTPVEFSASAPLFSRLYSYGLDPVEVGP